jgi:hypothetical protein
MTCATLAVLTVALEHLNAATIILNAVDSGHYSDAGSHLSSNKNYGVDKFLNGSNVLVDSDRNYFVFDLTGVIGPITGATLVVSNPQSGNSTSGLVFGVESVATSIPSLEGDHSSNSSDGLAIFNDLGAGNAYGSVTVNGPGNQSILLTSAALSDLNSTSGLFAFGGELLNGGSGDFVFGFTGSSLQTDVRELVLQTGDLGPSGKVPEPASVAVWTVGGIALLAGLIRRRRRACDEANS